MTEAAWVCRTCGKPVQPGAITCRSCGRFLMPEDIVPFAAEPEPQPAAADEGEPQRPPAAAVDERYDCGHAQQDGAERCPVCFGTEHRLAVEAPWGPLPLADGVVFLGRDPDFSPCAAGLSSWDNVSRRHAVIRTSDDGLLVEDVGSLNGTFVDGVRVERGRPQLAREGATIRLGVTAPVVLRVVRA